MKNCPNCGAPLDENYFKCPYCGTLYYDLTALDDSVPCFIKFNTMYGELTMFAKPELKDIEVTEDSIDCYMGNTEMCKFIRSTSCDIGIVFHTMIMSKNGNELFKIKIGDRQ